MVTKKVSKQVKVNMSSVQDLHVGLIAYIIGIVAIVQAFVSPFSGIILSIIGLVFSKKEDSTFSNKGRTLNTIALIIGILVLILTIFVAYNAPSLFGGA